eukprot:340515_1
MQANIFEIDAIQKDSAYEWRLITILNQHKKIFVQNHTTHQYYGDIIGLIHSFHPSYTLIHFQNDFDEYTRHAQANKLYPETFYSKLLQHANGIGCNISNCICISRNRRNKTLCKDNNFRSCLYGNDLTDKEIVYHQIIDSIHVHLFHLFDKGHKLLQSESELIMQNTYYDKDGYQIDSHITNQQLIKLLTNKFSIYREQCAKYPNNKTTLPTHNVITHNKFITPMSETNIENGCFREILITNLKVSKIHISNLKLFYDWLVYEEYDTDAISYDVSKISNDSNINIALNDDKRFYQL